MSTEKSEKPENLKLEMPVEVEQQQEKAMFLHSSLANGELPSGEKFNASLTMQGTILVKVEGPGERYYTVSLRAIISAALDAREKFLAGEGK